MQNDNYNMPNTHILPAGYGYIHIDTYESSRDKWEVEWSYCTPYWYAVKEKQNDKPRYRVVCIPYSEINFMKYVHYYILDRDFYYQQINIDYIIFYIKLN
jgi:hypothetical protein